jgi:hypothetical protein
MSKENDPWSVDDPWSVLEIICRDFATAKAAGANPENAAKPDSPRYFSQGNKPGETIRLLEALSCVTVQQWDSDYALGGTTPQFLVNPTERGLKLLTDLLVKEN